MIRRHIIYMLSAALLILTPMPAAAESAAVDNSVKRERVYISSGNKAFNAQKYEEAEAAYREALKANPTSETARYNLATTLLRRLDSLKDKAKEAAQKESLDILDQLARTASDKKIREYANYNLGNVAFNTQEYDKAIEYYKQALRLNPDNDKARQNLRLAQKKKQEQDQNKDQNNKDQNQNKDQDKKDQDKDQDKDQNKDDNQDKKDQQPPQQPKGSISDQNAEQILKAMENQENATRQRVNAKEGNAGGRAHGNPW